MGFELNVCLYMMVFLGTFSF